MIGNDPQNKAIKAQNGKSVLPRIKTPEEPTTNEDTELLCNLTSMAPEGHPCRPMHPDRCQPKNGPSAPATKMDAGNILEQPQ